MSKRVSNIKGLIDQLSSRAWYGIGGEKPLVILAGLYYLYVSQHRGQPIRGVSLSELLSSPLHSSAIRSKFEELAESTGKLKNPPSSWNTVVAHGRELLDILKLRGEADEAFRRLTEDETYDLLDQYFSELKLSLELIEPTPSRKYQLFQKEREKLEDELKTIKSELEKTKTVLEVYEKVNQNVSLITSLIKSEDIKGASFIDWKLVKEHKDKIFFENAKKFKSAVESAPREFLNKLLEILPIVEDMLNIISRSRVPRK